MMWLDDLKRAVALPNVQSSDFDLNAGAMRSTDQSPRPAAVLIPVMKSESGPVVWLTKRSAALKHHPGQISFPGGKQDPADLDLTATALREAQEEIGLSSDNVEIIGQLGSHETVTNFEVTPILGRIRDHFDPILEIGEVAEVFCIPLSHVLKPENFVIEHRVWAGKRRYFYAVPYGPHYIWGATARILRSLSERMTR